jgi:Tfp pilus assembly protein PilW
MRTRQRLRRATAGDAGISLAETLVGMFLAAILGLIVMQALVASSKGARHVADDATVQQQQQTVVERLSRDLRVARGVDGSSSTTSVVVWVDGNSDYFRDPGETVTWSLAVNAATGRCELSRSTDLIAARVMSANLANAACGAATGSDPAFRYYDGSGNETTNATASVRAGTTTRIDVLLSFKVANSAANARVSQFSLRMRNVA